MGCIIRYTHKRCDFKFDFRAGVGFVLFGQKYEARKHMRNGDWGERWKKLIEQYPYGTATINNSLCYCEQCKQYHVEPQIKFYIPKEGCKYKYDDTDYVYPFDLKKYFILLETEVITCPKCDNETIAMQYPSKVKCPMCGEMRRGRQIGNWD